MKARTTLVLASLLLLLAIPSVAVAQGDIWLPSTGPYGGYIRALATDSLGTVYAGTGCGLYRSRDNGARWSLVHPAIGDSTVVGAAVTADGSVFAILLKSRTIYRSTDGGESWSYRGLAPNIIFELVVSSTGMLVARSENAVFRSTDQGSTWKKYDTVFPERPQTKVYHEWTFTTLRLDETRMLAGTYNGIYLTTDGGQSWSESDSGITGLSIDAIAVGPSGTVLAGGEHGLHRSTDGGTIWIWTPHPDWNDSIDFPKVEALAVMADGSRDGIVLARFRNRIYRSIDNGATWQRTATLTNNDTRHWIELSLPMGSSIPTGAWSALVEASSNLWAREPHGGDVLREQSDTLHQWRGRDHDGALAGDRVLLQPGDELAQDRRLPRQRTDNDRACSDPDRRHADCDRTGHVPESTDRH